MNQVTWHRIWRTTRFVFGTSDEIIVVHGHLLFPGEIKVLFKTTAPKIAFCQNETFDIYKQVAEELKLDLQIVTFDEVEYTLNKVPTI